MTLRKLVLLVYLMVVATTSYAQVLWTGAKKVTAIEVVQDGGFLVYLDSEINTACTQAGTKALYIYPNQSGVTDPGIKSLLATALAAFSSDRFVNIMYWDDTPYCWGQFLIISK